MEITHKNQDENPDHRVPAVSEPSQAECMHEYIEVCRLCELRRWDDVRAEMKDYVHSAMVLMIWGGRFPDHRSRLHVVDVMLLLKGEAHNIIRGDTRPGNTHG